MTSEEQPDFQRALEASLKASAIQARCDAENAKAYLQRREWSEDIDKLSEDAAKNPFPNETLPEPISPPRETIDDCIRDISISQAREVPRITDPGGDTYVVITPPSKQPEQSDRAYKWCQHRYSKPHIMRSEKLSKASPLFKEKLESPTYQFRTLRRHGLVGKIPSNITYVLDLTPPTEGDDAVYLTASLCCSQGVRYWHEAGDLWKVSDTLVGGKEEHGAPQSERLASSDSSSLEYSPFRHRSAIERVLAAIQGEMVTIDSAVKLWTTAIVAQFFGITYDSCVYLTDSIISWLRVEPNFVFLEVNPEVSLRVAVGLDNHDLTRDAFAILVGEEALDSLSRNKGLKDMRQISTFGRKKDDLPEALMDSVEYASKTFIEWMIKDFESLVYGHMQWLEDLPAIKRLDDFYGTDMEEHVTSLKSALKSYERGAIFRTLFSEANGPPLAGGSQHLLPSQTHKDVWLYLAPTQRVLTRMFWSLLREDSSYYSWLPGGLLDSSKEQDPLTQKLDPRELRSPKEASETISSIVQDGQRTLDRRSTVGSPHFTSAFDSPLPARQLNGLSLKSAHGITASRLPIREKDAAHLAEDQGKCEAKDMHGILPDPPGSSPPDYASRYSGRTAPIPIPRRSLAPSGSSTAWDTEKHTAARDSFVNNTPQTQGIADLGPGLGEDGYSTKKQRPTSHLWKLEDKIWSTGYIEDPEEIEDTSDSWDHYSLSDHPGKRSVGNSWSTESEQIPTIRPEKLEETKESRDSYPSSGQVASIFTVPGTNWRSDWVAPPDQQSELGSQTFFDFSQFSREADAYISDFASKKLLPSDTASREDPYRPTIIGTLTCLQDSEWKYLPLWAGGLDDGTGAVYNDDIMETAPDMGFSTAGPSIHTGSSTYSDNGDFDMLSDAGTSSSSFNPSTAVMDGHTDQLHRHQTYSASSISSTDDSIVDLVKDEEEEAARRQVAAYEAAEVAASAAEAAKRGRERARCIDEDEDTLCDDDLESDFDDDDDSDGDVTEKGEDDDNVTDDDGFDDLGNEPVDDDGDVVLV